MSISSSVLHQLQRLNQETYEKKAAELRHKEQLETMDAEAGKVITDLAQKVQNAFLTKEERDNVITWTFSLSGWDVQVTSAEVLAQFDEDDQFSRYFKDIIERLVVDKLSKLHP